MTGITTVSQSLKIISPPPFILFVYMGAKYALLSFFNLGKPGL
jgi:hypothetical protein